MADDKPVRILNVSKSYGNIKAVDRFTLEIEQGEIFALVGPNGAGKTTLIKMVTGLEPLDSGEILLCGKSIAASPVNAKSKIGYVSDNPEAYPYLTATEFLSLCGKIRKIPADLTSKRIEHLLDIFPIRDIADSFMGDYSRGNKQKVAILAALISRPEVLIIDEPIVGLDPESIGILGKLIKEYAHSEKTVIFITHILKFAADNADRVAVMKNGRLKFIGKVTKSLNLEDLLL